MNVLQVLPALESGGVERGTLEVAAELVRQGHHSTVISADGRLVQPLKEQGSQHINWPIGKKSLATLRYISTLKQYLLQHPTDILHARSRLPAWIAWAAWRSLRDRPEQPKLVTTFHGFYSPGWYSKVMTRGEVIIAPSMAIRDYILEQYPETRPDRIRVIYRGVDPEQYQNGYQPSEAWLQAWQQEYPQLANQYVITLPGRITRLKGCEDLIQIMRQLKHSNVHALVVGDIQRGKESFYSELKQQIETSDLSSKITFTGHRSDALDIFAISDAVLSLSNKPESFGRTTLEALTLGRPVLGYDYGGVGEQLNALLPEGKITPLDTDAAVAKIKAWQDSAPTPKQNTQFTLSNMLTETLSTYEKLIDQNYAQPGQALR